MEPTLGPIDDYVEWSSFEFHDLRGRLTKPFGSLPFSPGEQLEFSIHENFLTISKKDVFRGMHMQVGEHPTRKIVSVVTGSVQDILVDCRINSSTFRNVYIQKLTSNDPKAIMVPVGVAHGYLVLEPETVVQYLYDGEFCIDCDLGFHFSAIKNFLSINSSQIILSSKDQGLPKEILQVH